MNVLFIGGTGLISKAVSELAVSKGINLFLLNRGSRTIKGATTLIGDIHRIEETRELLRDYSFDVVVDFIAFTLEDVKRDYELFKGKTKQYIFISSASAYYKPIPFYPITEATPLGNKYWQYSDNKRICEEYLLSKQDADFNVTIVRPAHTYNDDVVVSYMTSWPHPYTTIHRILEGKPTIIPGNGKSLWTLTHNTDFAAGFVDLLGNKDTYGEHYHLTSSNTYTWEQINEILCNHLGVTPNIIHIPTDFIIQHAPWLEGELAGDKDWSLIFDNSKIKQVAPNYKSSVRYEDIAPKAINRFLKNKDLQTVDKEFDELQDKIIKAYLKQT